jgi:mannan endo-1,4-beta-mannosidase
MALGPELVGVRGGRFDLAGSKFPVVGANNYYLGFATPPMRGDAIAAAKGFGFNVLRAWAFVDCKTWAPGTEREGTWRGAWFQEGEIDQSGKITPRVNDDSDDGLNRLDHLIADANQAEIRLILPLVNHWPGFGGMDAYVGWFGGGARDRFYRDAGIRAAYQSYVQKVLTRRNTVTKRLYRDEPSIFAWELANEPQCNTRDGRVVLLEWVRTMSQWVKQWDPNHLLAVGDEGHFANGSGDLYDGRHGVDCAAFLQVAEIDFGTFHLYPQVWNQPDPILFGNQWIEDHLTAGARAGKPMILEEYGMTVGAGGLPSALPRNFIYRCWLQTILSKQGAGDLAWMIAGEDDMTGKPYLDYDHFTFYSPGDVMSIRDHVLQMTAGAPSDDPQAISIPGEGQGIVHLWVTDAAGNFLDEKQTTVIVKRDGSALGDPLELDFSGGGAQLAIPVNPQGNLMLQIEPQKYRMCNSNLFRLEERARVFIHVTTSPDI